LGDIKNFSSTVWIFDPELNCISSRSYTFSEIQEKNNHMLLYYTVYWWALSASKFITLCSAVYQRLISSVSNRFLTAINQIKPNNRCKMAKNKSEKCASSKSVVNFPTLTD
jgi:hypothetical protein